MIDNGLSHGETHRISAASSFTWFVVGLALYAGLLGLITALGE